MVNYIFWFIQIIYFLFLLIMLFISPQHSLWLKRYSLITSYCFLTLVVSLGLLFSTSDILIAPGFLIFELVNSQLLNIQYAVSFDTLSYVFMLLTALLIPISLISSWNNIKFNLKEFLITLVTVEWILLNMFSVSDLLFFYIWFEAVLLPMYFLIGVWGSRQRKTYASFMFFFYTFIGSLFLLFALFLLYAHYGSLNLYTLLNTSLLPTTGLVIWPLLMFAFAVKVPMFPAHIWLPEAHVEAPTVGSVLLAGVLLKLGIFAVLRYLIPIFPMETQYYSSFVSVFALLGILYISLTTIRQIDLKKIIAYASVAHMNYVVLGILSTNLLGISGSIFLMIGHGIVSAGLFFMIGFLYDRYKTRNIRYYRGLVAFMPLYAVSLFILSLANMSFPGTCNFIGEAIILFGILGNNVLITWIAAIGIIFCAIYTIWLFNRIMYGPITPSIYMFADLSFKELFTLSPLLVLTIYLGLFPNYLFTLLSDASILLLEYYY